MDFLSDDLPEDVADSKWLSEETNALVSKIGTALSSGAPVDAVAASSSGQLTNDANATPGQSDALLPKFGAHVRVRFKGHEHAFVLGRTNPMTLPIPLFEVIKTMKVGDRKRLDSVSEPPKHPSLVLAEDEAPSASKVPSTSDASGPKWEPSDEVELLEVEKVEHVVSGGSIVKRVIECPEETRNDRHTPVFETVVTLDLLGRLEDTNEIFDKRENATFRIGEGELGMGMEKAVRTMHRGEKSQFTFMPPWPISLCDAPLIPITPTELKNTVVVYDVYLKSFVDAKNPFECKTYEDHLEEALLRKESGNRAHEAKKYTLAITKYTKAQYFLEQFGHDFETEEQRKTYDQLKASLALNLAASNLKLEQYEKVKLHCTNALEIEPKNVKGLYRRASALVALKDFDGAHKDLQELLNLEPDNALAKHLMKRVETKFAQDSMEQRKVYQQMFAPRDEPKAEPTGKGVQSARQETKDSKWTLYVIIATLVLVLAYAANMFMSTKNI